MGSNGPQQSSFPLLRVRQRGTQQQNGWGKKLGEFALLLPRRAPSSAPPLSFFLLLFFFFFFSSAAGACLPLPEASEACLSNPRVSCLTTQRELRERQGKGGGTCCSARLFVCSSARQRSVPPISSVLVSVGSSTPFGAKCKRATNMIKQILGKLPRKPSSKIPSVSDPATTTTSYSSGNNSDDGRFAATSAQPLHAPNSTSVSKNPSKVSSAEAKPSNLGPGPSTANKSSQAKKSSVLATAGLVMSNNLNASDLASPLPACMPAYEALPGFRDVPNSEKHSLFLKKINMCCVVFDFSDPSRNPKEKDVKRQTLLELVDYVTSVTAKFSEVAMQEITRMVAANLFRTFPPSNHDSKLLDTYDPEEEEPAMEPAWPHLQIVYEFLLRFVASPEMDAKIAKRYIDHSFVLRLLDLFDSEDQREREYLKTILHRVYGKFMVHRPFIRKAINHIFYRFIFETEKHNGVAELLEILGSIINGFALPLKEEHKLFLVRALIPLHKPKCVAAYHQQLSYCIIQFVEKDFKLADTVIRGLLKFWPITNSSKEVMFLGELEEILEVTQVAEFQRCMVPLFRLIGRCLNSSHFQELRRMTIEE
ncbi:hypothetical protein Taro_017074 [Colocasia esculenta]|uniref:Serine/threonine protein phosphatase 2A regulatory subunit n=1 Tax=Colocasia esculenta TaxID=4460 RepID=A0A843UM68_COLES|nr:hypothetical protein [Colocasia esculenta]